MIPALIVAVALFMVIAAAPVAADQGVAVDLGIIEVEQPLYPGETYRLPTLGVRNPGDQPASYAMGVGQTGAEGLLAPGEAWFTFTPSAFELEPGASVPVTIRMHVPTDAEPGHYEGIVRAQLAAEGEGALVAAAAGARLTFEVRASTSIASLVRQLLATLEDLRPWSYVVPLLILAAFVVWRLSRRFNVRLERRA